MITCTDMRMASGPNVRQVTFIGGSRDGQAVEMSGIIPDTLQAYVAVRNPNPEYGEWPIEYKTETYIIRGNKAFFVR